MKLGIKISLTVALLVIQSLAYAQSKDLLVKNANKGDEKAMYELGLSLIGKEGAEKDSYTWIKHSADKGYVPSQALQAYLTKNGIGTEKDLDLAWKLAQKALEQGDGFAYWIVAQICLEKGVGSDVIHNYLNKSFDARYPLAQLLFAKNYAKGDPSWGIQKDVDKSWQILTELSGTGNAEACALLGVRYLESPQVAFPYLLKASDAGIPVAAGLVANMYYYGTGTPKNIQEAFKYYEKAGSMKDPAGMEGLADCYRIGVGTGVFQERAFNLYKDFKNPSPRVMYILGCYYNEGISTAKDTQKAIDYYEKAAAKGDVFAQALLGTSYYDGSAPFESKDYEKAYPFLRGVINNKDIDQLPAVLAEKVYNYAARCYRFGRGGAIKDADEAAKLQEKADALSEAAGTQQVPFALSDVVSFAETVSACDLSWDSEMFENILDNVTFDYPKDYLKESGKPVTKTPEPVIEKKAPAPKQPAQPKAPGVARGKSGKLAVMIETAPYCFAPSSVVSSRDGKTYWLKGSAIDVSASVGWLTNSGLFIGAGAGFETFSGSRMSVIQGFVDARYFLGSGSGLFFGVRGGVGLGSPEYGIGITAAGMLGYKVSIGEKVGLNIGLKAGINSFTDDNKTMGNVVGPFVGISF